MNRTMMRTLAGVTAGVLSLTLAACSQSDDSGSSDGRVTVTFWHGYTEADGDVLQQIIDEFNASQATVTVKTEVKPWDVIDDTLLTSLSADEGPDVVAMPAERLPVYADKGAFASLDDFYDDPASNTAELNPGAVDMVTVDGTRYGVPTGFVPLAMFYNKALFEKAGIDAPPATWDDWIADAKQLTVDTDGDGKPEQYGVAIPDHATVANGVWPSLFYGNGGDVVQDGTTAVIDSPENAQTLTTWRDAIVNDHISPTGLDGIKGDGLFSSGKAAMYLGGPWMASIAAENKLDYGIAPVPAGPVTQAASAIGVSMAITDHGDDDAQHAAEDFFSYFLDKQNCVEWSLGSGWPPLRTDVPASDVSDNPVVAALTEQAALGRPLLPGVINSTDVLTAVDELTQQVMAGGDIDELLAAAQSSIQSTLDDQ